MRKKLLAGLALTAALFIPQAAFADNVSLNGNYTGYKHIGPDNRADTATVTGDVFIKPGGKIDFGPNGTLINSDQQNTIYIQAGSDNSAQLVFGLGSKYEGGGLISVQSNYGDFWGDEDRGLVNGLIANPGVNGLSKLLSDTMLVNGAYVTLDSEEKQGASIIGDINMQYPPMMAYGGALVVKALDDSKISFHGNVNLGGNDLYIYQPDDLTDSLDGHVVFEKALGGVGQLEAFVKGKSKADFNGQVNVQTRAQVGSFGGGGSNLVFNNTLTAGYMDIYGGTFNQKVTATGAFPVYEFNANGTVKHDASGAPIFTKGHDAVIILDDMWTAEMAQTTTPNKSVNVFNNGIDTGSKDIIVGGGDNTFDGITNTRYMDVLVSMHGKGIEESDAGQIVFYDVWGEDGKKPYEYMIKAVKNSTPTVKMKKGAEFNVTEEMTVGKNGSLVLLGNAAINAKKTSFIEGGTVDVGNNNLQIKGNVLFDKDSTFKVALDRDSARIIGIGVKGQATIENGATLVVGGVSLAEAGSKNIFTATSFKDDTLFHNTLYNLKFDQAKQNIVLDGIKGTAPAIENAGGVVTPNYASVGTLIDAVVTSPNTSPELQKELTGAVEAATTLMQKDARLGKIAMSQIAGESAVHSTTAVFDTVRQFQSALNSHANSQRDAQFAQANGLAAAAGSGDSLNRIWLGGFGTWAKQKNKDAIFGYDYNTAGVVMGYDRMVDSLPGLTLGLSGAWSNGEVDNKDGFASTDIDTMSLSLYGNYDFGNGLFLDGNFGYGLAKNDATINLVGGGSKTGDYDSKTYQFGLNMGYTFQPDETSRIIPSIGVQFTHLKQDGWQERIVSDPNNTAVANRFASSSDNMVEIPIALRINKTFECENGATVTPELRLGWVYAAKQPDAEMNVGFVGSGDTAVIHGVNPARNRFQVGAGVKAQLNDTVDIFANYDFETRKDFNSHSTSVGLGFSF